MKWYEIMICIKSWYSFQIALLAVTRNRLAVAKDRLAVAKNRMAVVKGRLALVAKIRVAVAKSRLVVARNIRPVSFFLFLGVHSPS